MLVAGRHPVATTAAAGISAVLRAALPCTGRGGGWRSATALVRRRRRSYYQAQKDPRTHPGTLKKLREEAAVPSVDLLRYIAENKISKAVTTADRRALWFELTKKRYAPVFLSQVCPRMRFWTGALEESQLPLPRLPEVAMAGRSNSGKSTLINYLCGRHSAHVKREPGSTTELVFWQIGRPAQLCLVDLPGYGFAFSPEETRLQWTEFTLWYLRSRRNLRKVLLLVDARHGLKPADKEMISYLERHRVPWQIIVTKCDLVKSKELARRLTVLNEDVCGYVKMVEAPIPLSALKMHGMDKLRNILERCKVQKEMVKNGIRQRVYDLMEQKRIQRGERRKRRLERKRAEVVEKHEAAKQSSVDSEFHSGGGGEAENHGDHKRTSLHNVLDDSGSTVDNTLAGTTAGAEVTPRKPMVTEARYSIDDRDSRRIEGIMHGLFPDLLAVPNRNSDRGRLAETSPAGLAAVSGWADTGYPFHANAHDLCKHEPSSALDSDSDDEDAAATVAAVPMPPVLRFEPTPRHAGGGGTPPSHPKVEGRKTVAISDPLAPPLHEHLTLRKEWLRPPAILDQVYTEDDFASPQDLAGAKRLWAPPAPTPETRGQLLMEARRRYEQEWAMELENIDQERAGAGGAGTAAVVAPPPPEHKAPSKASRRRWAAASAARPQPSPPWRAPYIHAGGSKPILYTRGGKLGSWRALGRPPPKVLKRRRLQDIAKVFGVENRNKSKKKTSGLEWKEAKEHWMKWFERNKKGYRFQRVIEAGSPKKEAVEAEYEARQQRLSRRIPLRRRRSDQTNLMDER